MQRDPAAHLLLLSVGAIWGLNFVVMKILLAEVSPVNLILFRFIIGSGLLFLLLAATQDIKVSARDLVSLALLGITGISIYQFFFTFALKYTSVANASIIINTAPLWGAFLAVLLRFERVRKKVFLAVMVGMLGTWTLITKGTFRLGPGETQGNMLALACSVLWAVYTLFAKPLLDRHSPLKVTAYSMALGALFLCPLLPFYLDVQEFARLSPVGWLSLAFAILFSVVIGFFLWYKGIARIGPSRTLIYSYLVPVFAVFFAYVLLGERFSLAQGAGTALVFLSIYLAQKA
jgi:drug/metabolite transporter (DMT)-like permease